jgi:hypothetical protein
VSIDATNRSDDQSLNDVETGEVDLDKIRRDAQDKRRRRILLWGSCCLLFGLVTYLSSLGGPNPTLGLQWYRTNATVVTTEVQETLVREKNPSGPGSSEMRQYQPVAVINYSAGGLLHESRCHVGAPTFVIKEANICVAPYYSGKTLRVYYNASNPDQTSLSPKLDDPRMQKRLCGFAAIWLGGLFLIAWFFNGLYQMSPMPAAAAADPLDISNRGTLLAETDARAPEAIEDTNKAQERSTRLASPLLDGEAMNDDY